MLNHEHFDLIEKIANASQEINTPRFVSKMHLLSSEVSTLKTYKSWTTSHLAENKNNYKAGQQLFVLPMHTLTKT